MTDLVFAMPGAEDLATDIADVLGVELGQMQTHTFPDQESYFRLLTPVSGRDILIVAYLHDPNPKTLPLLLFAEGVRQQGARTLILFAPYLPHMRQDTQFNPGEVVSAEAFAKLLSGAFDRLITVDPHLHRYMSLDELYAIPTLCVSSAPVLATWIKANASSPLLIGPDEESQQWVSKIAGLIEAPYQTLRKSRKGDRDVAITLPDMDGLGEHSIVLVDDMISTGETMRQVISLIKAARPDLEIFCCATHGLAGCVEVTRLREAGAAVIVTTKTVPGSVATIPIHEQVAEQGKAFLNID